MTPAYDAESGLTVLQGDVLDGNIAEHLASIAPIYACRCPDGPSWRVVKTKSGSGRFEVYGVCTICKERVRRRGDAGLKDGYEMRERMKLLCEDCNCDRGGNQAVLL